MLRGLVMLLIYMKKHPLTQNERVSRVFTPILQEKRNVLYEKRDMLLK